MVTSALSKCLTRKASPVKVVDILWALLHNKVCGENVLILLGEIFVTVDRDVLTST